MIGFSMFGSIAMPLGTAGAFWHAVLSHLPALSLLSLLLLLVMSALYVHFRGKVRHKFARQLTDHSTFMAPYNALIYLFSGVANKPILDKQDFPEMKVLRDNWELIRDEALRLYEEGHIRKSEN